MAAREEGTEQMGAAIDQLFDASRPGGHHQETVSDLISDVRASELNIDDLLGSARRVLRHAAEAYCSSDTPVASDAETLSEALRDLATHLQERQMHQLGLAERICALGDS